MFFYRFLLLFFLALVSTTFIFYLHYKMILQIFFMKKVTSASMDHNK